MAMERLEHEETISQPDGPENIYSCLPSIDHPSTRLLSL